MTNEEVREVLQEQIDKYGQEYDDRGIEALKTAIKMLEQQPSDDSVFKNLWAQVKWERDVAIEQLEQLGYSLGEKIRTSEDCVSKKIVLDMLENINAETEGVGFYYEHYVDYIKDLPSVIPQKPKGKWIPIHPLQEDDPGAYMCSVCGCGDWGLDPKIDNFCFNCGADMRESEEQ